MSERTDDRAQAPKNGTEWGIKHHQGIANCANERDARERLPGFVAQYESNHRNTTEPKIVRREVTEWYAAELSTGPTPSGGDPA
jgi:hypothetical protein